MCSTLANKDAIEKYKYATQYAGLFSLAATRCSANKFTFAWHCNISISMADKSFGSLDMLATFNVF